MNSAIKDLQAAMSGAPMPESSKGIIKIILNEGPDNVTPNIRGRKLVSKKNKAILQQQRDEPFKKLDQDIEQYKKKFLNDVNDQKITLKKDLQQAGDQDGNKNSED